jgi:uncharacterized RDD family membrane protein YckC
MQPASYSRRLLAFCIDLALLRLCLSFLGRHFTVTGIGENWLTLFRWPGLSMRLRLDAPAVVEILGFFFYFLLFEQMTAAGSPGKFVTGLLVQDDAGKKPSLGRSLVRTAFKSALFLLWPLVLLWMAWKRNGLLPYDRLLQVWIVRRTRPVTGA